MVASNALDITQTGIVTFDGVQTFTGQTPTNHYVLVGTGGGTITSVSPSTSGFVLTSNGASSDPSFQSVSASGAVTSVNGDTGTATPSSGVLNIKTGSATQNSGATFLSSGSGSTLTFNVSDASLNTLVGNTSGNATLSGAQNTGFGSRTLTSLTSGQFNTCVGDAAGTLINTGSQNTTVGQGAGRRLTTGGNNTLIGVNAGGQGGSGITTGSFNVCVGYQPLGAYTSSESSNIMINNNGVNGESNTLRIGAATGSSDGQLNRAFICGINGVNVGSVSSVLTNSGDQLGTATITAGTNISVTPGANTITIASTGSASFTWSIITANQTAVVNNGYICNKASTLVLALPATASAGDLLEVTGINTALGWQITQAANQQIFFGTTQTTLGATGTLTSSATRDSVRMVCVVAGASTVWNVISSVGNPTVV